MTQASQPPQAERKMDRKAVIDAVEQYDLTESPAWQDLNTLSARTILDGVEVDPDGVILDDDQFRGVMNVYVVLRYGSSKDGFETSDSFLGNFKGHFVQGEGPVIDQVSVDTSPFFEGER